MVSLTTARERFLTWLQRWSALQAEPATSSDFALTPPVGCPRPYLACDECTHIFTAEDVDAEDPREWGHPCHADTTIPVAACESHRTPIAPAAATTVPSSSCLSGCPHPEQIAALIDGALPEPELGEVTAHLVWCDACRNIVVNVLIADPHGRRPSSEHIARAGSTVR